MNVFLIEMSRMYKNQKIVLVMDGAGWHKSKALQLPENIEIFYLPPYSPELNPVEKLWQFVKDNVLRNKTYQSLESLIDEVCLFISNINAAQLASICACNYLFN